VFEFGITHSSCCCDSRSLIYKGVGATLVHIHSLSVGRGSRGRPSGKGCIFFPKPIEEGIAISSASGPQRSSPE